LDVRETGNCPQESGLGAPWPHAARPNSLLSVGFGRAEPHQFSIRVLSVLSQAPLSALIYLPADISQPLEFTMEKRFFVSSHAIDQYIERINPTMTRPEAALLLRELLEVAHVRSRPRKWTGIRATPGTRYLYSAAHPGVCLVERDGRIRTVFGRETSRQWRHIERCRMFGEAA
jgi:hypothetical protein